MKNRRVRLRHLDVWAFVVLSIASISVSITLGQDHGESNRRPNVLVILADDLGFSDLGCYGGEIRTPHLDRLAQEGIRFTQFYNNSKCTESRASLLSGLYYQQTDNLRKKNHLLLPEILGAAGYTTLMSGKWHLPETPLERGFDKFFGFLGGAINYFTGFDFSSGENQMRLNEAPFSPQVDFYSTNAFTAYALEFLREAELTKKPFFLYLAYNAPHFPLQSPAEEIERYRGAFLQGWDSLREERFGRLLALDFIRRTWQLSPRDPIVPSWSRLARERHAEEDLLMATYAGMVTRMDSQIGRLLDYLRTNGALENTVVFFLSDNGGCPYRFNRTPSLPPGPAESYRSYDSEWANLSNVPFRLYKQWAHEGGISTPLIVRLPSVVRTNSVAHNVGHIIDIFPTVLELAGLNHPSSAAYLRLEGESLVPILTGDSAERERTLCWEFRGHHSVRKGKWKLVAESGQGWELYDMSTDRVELRDLVDQQSERVSRMAGIYDAWANRVGALTHHQSLQKGVSTQAR